MNNTIPGIDGSMGKCGYCGENFLGEILLGKSVATPSIGGQPVAMHKDGCFDKFMALGKDGRLEFSVWRELPEASPLIPELKRLEKELAEQESKP